jgi:hypothetical protein
MQIQKFSIALAASSVVGEPSRHHGPPASPEQHQPTKTSSLLDEVLGQVFLQPKRLELLDSQQLLKPLVRNDVSAGAGTQAGIASVLQWLVPLYPDPGPSDMCTAECTPPLVTRVLQVVGLEVIPAHEHMYRKNSSVGTLTTTTSAPGARLL